MELAQSFLRRCSRNTFAP
jgi:ATP-dependent RNA helicase DDX55/SPB4